MVVGFEDGSLKIYKFNPGDVGLPPEIVHEQNISNPCKQDDTLWSSLKYMFKQTHKFATQNECELSYKHAVPSYSAGRKGFLVGFKNGLVLFYKFPGGSIVGDGQWEEPSNNVNVYMPFIKPTMILNMNLSSTYNTFKELILFSDEFGNIYSTYYQLQLSVPDPKLKLANQIIIIGER